MRLLIEGKCVDPATTGNFIEFLIGQTGTAAVAILALWQLDRLHKDALRREQENTNSHREDKRALIEALQANAKAIAELESTVERLIDRAGRNA